MFSAVTELESLREEFVSLWGSMGSFWGISAGAARVYGWLLSKKEPATADEMMAGMSMSRGAVSMASRELRDWGLVRGGKVAGRRQIVYSPETDLERAVRSIVAARKRREWDPILSHLREWIPRLEAARSAEAVVFRERLRSIEAIVSMADSMAESFLRGGMVHRLGLKMLVKAAERRRKGPRSRDSSPSSRSPPRSRPPPWWCCGARSSCSSWSCAAARTGRGSGRSTHL